jgi:hypothetical protein
MNLHIFFKRFLVLSALSVGICSSVASAAYNFTKIADINTSTPFGEINGILIPPVVEGSDVAFQAAIETSHFGIFKGNGGPLSKIVRTGDPAPTGVFSSIGTAQPSISNGHVVFRGIYGAGQSVEGRIFSGNGGSLSTVAKGGDSAGPVTFGPLSFDYPVVNDGNVAFMAGFSGGSGVFSGNASSFSVIVKSGDIAPQGTFESNFSQPSVSGDKVAFVGQYGNRHGIFVGSGGSLTNIVEEGDVAPVGEFYTVGSPAIDGDSVAFIGRYGTTNGIFLKDALGLREIVSEGDVTSVGILTNLGRPAISGDFVAFLGASSSGIGVFVGDENGLKTVVKAGDLLFGQVVKTIGFANGLDPNGSGNVAFAYALQNGVSGIALAIPVPEPTSMSLAVFLCFAFAICRRPRRR